MIYITDTKPLYRDDLFRGLYLNTYSHFREKIDRKKLREDQNRTLAGAVLLKKGIEKMGVNPDVRIKVAPKGKPYIDGFFFNISHSGDKAVCAFGTSEIGVDIEKIKPLSERLMDKIALPSERAKISAAKQIIQRPALTQAQQSALFIGQTADCLAAAAVKARKQLHLRVTSSPSSQGIRSDC